MAKSAPSTAGGRKIISSPTKPSHLASRSGPGRTRQPTDFDDLVPEWYEKDEWFKIPAEGDTDEEMLADVEEVFKAVNRAVQYHNLGVDRLKEDNPSNEEFTGYGVWVHVRERQVRKRKNKDADGNVIEDTDENESDDDYSGDDE